MTTPSARVFSILLKDWKCIEGHISIHFANLLRVAKTLNETRTPMKLIVKRHVNYIPSGFNTAQGLKLYRGAHFDTFCQLTACCQNTQWDENSYVAYSYRHAELVSASPFASASVPLVTCVKQSHSSYVLQHKSCFLYRKSTFCLPLSIPAQSRI